jgi:division protein CdvB (Snf7/Vps24/ESCRT-III family)
MTDSLSGDSFNTMQSDVSNEETDAILQEASTVAEQQTDEKFPSIPTTTPTGLPSQTTSNSMNFLE